MRFQHADGLVLRLDDFLLRAEQGLKVFDFLVELFVFHGELSVAIGTEWGSGAALPEGVEGDAEEVGQRLQFREADVLGAAKIGHGLLALLEEPGDEPLLLLAWQLGVEAVNEFDVQHCIFALGVNDFAIF